MKSVDEPFVAVQVFDIYIYGKNRSYFHRQMLSMLCLCEDKILTGGLFYCVTVLQTNIFT